MPLLDACYSEAQYLQSCEVCGRPAIIAIELSGQSVGCGHCGGTFMAVELPQQPNASTYPSPESTTRFTIAQNMFRLAASFLTAISNILGESVGL